MMTPFLGSLATKLCQEARHSAKVRWTQRTVKMGGQAMALYAIPTAGLATPHLHFYQGTALLQSTLGGVLISTLKWWCQELPTRQS